MFSFLLFSFLLFSFLCFFLYFSLFSSLPYDKSNFFVFFLFRLYFRTAETPGIRLILFLPLTSLIFIHLFSFNLKGVVLDHFLWHRIVIDEAHEFIQDQLLVGKFLFFSFTVIILYITSYSLASSSRSCSC